MQSEDEYLERTPDLVAKVRAMRNAAQQEMDRFTRVSDYGVRRVVGHGSKPAPVSIETSVTAPSSQRPKTSSNTSAPTQTPPESAPASVEPGGDGENA